MTTLRGWTGYVTAAALPSRSACRHPAWAAVRTKDSYLRAQFLRLKSRRGPKKAIIAVAASMLRAIYFMLQRGVPYCDLGGTYFDRRDKARIARRLLDRLRDLGVQVEVTAAA